MPTEIENFPWDQLEYLSTGADSTVFRRGNQVLKRYDHTPLIVVEKYAALHNKSAAYVASHPVMFTDFLYPHRQTTESIPIGYEIVPIKNVKISQENIPVGISEFIPGPSLYWLTSQGDEWDHQAKDLKKSEIQALLKIRQALRGEGYISRQFSFLAPTLDRELGVRGINLDKINVKVRFDISKQWLKFIITDLASHLNYIAALWVNNKT